MQPNSLLSESLRDNSFLTSTTGSAAEIGDPPNIDARVSLATVNTVKALSREINAALEESNDLAWTKAFHTFYKKRFFVPIAILLKAYAREIQQFRSDLNSSRYRARNVDMHATQKQYAQYIFPDILATLKILRKEYETASLSVQAATDTDLIARFIKFRRSLTKVRIFAKDSKLGAKFLENAVSTLPNEYFSFRNGFLLGKLRHDLEGMRSLTTNACFFDSSTARGQRDELTERLRHYLSRISNEERLKIVTDIQERLPPPVVHPGNDHDPDDVSQLENLEILSLISELTDDTLVKDLVAKCQNRFGVAQTSTEIASLIKRKGQLRVIRNYSKNFVNIKEDKPERRAQTCSKIDRIFCFSLLLTCSVGLLATHLYPNSTGFAYGNSRRFITQCPNPGYETLSSIEEAFYRYESGEISGKQIIVDLFLAGEKMTPSNSRIAFQLAIDDPNRGRIDLLNTISREFLEDFECAGNSLLVIFIRHNAEIRSIEAAVNKGASLEATLHGITPMMAAILQDKAHIVYLLWKLGASVSSQALHILTHHRDSDMRRIACEMEHCNVPFTGVTTDLHRLAETGTAEEVAKYIGFGADVNVWDESGRSPLDLGHMRMHIREHIYPLERRLDSYRVIQILRNAGTTRTSERYPTGRIQPLVANFKYHQENPSMFPFQSLSLVEQEVHFHKILRHSFETDQKIYIYDLLLATGAGGAVPGFSLKMLESFDSFIKQYGECLRASEVSLVRSILADGTNPTWDTLSAQDIVTRITQSKKIVQIHSGFNGHAIEMFFLPLPTVTYLVINDKLLKQPLEIYQIDPKKVTEETIQELLELADKHISTYELWMWRLQATFGAQSTPLGSRIKQAYPGERQQKAGNCAWESLETAVYSALALGRLTNLYPGVLLSATEDVIEKELQKVAHVFSQWLTYTQLFVVENYLDLHTTPEMQLAIPMDQSVMNSVFAHLQDAVAILPDGHERFAKTEARYAALLDQEELLGYHMHSVWTRSFAAGLRKPQKNLF